VRVALYDDPVFREHDSGPGHPERPERLDFIRRALDEAGLLHRLVLLSPRPATAEELQRVHTPDHVRRIAGTAGRTVRFDPDTQAGPRSYEAALKAAGAVVDAVDRVLDGEIDRAFCLVRPPGHHAETATAMGFCFFNNVAVGAAQALARGLSRVMIVDFDVHHGNGTQEIFYAEPRVLYVSSHAYPFYPGTGALAEIGEGPGRGFNLNLPLPHGAGDQEYTRAYREIVEVVGRAFDPELVLVSAGFDAHEGDPLANMRLTRTGYAELTAVCLGVASGTARGRVVFVLEGGYGASGLAQAGTAVTEGLMNDAVKPAAAPPAEPDDFDALLHLYRRQFQPFWPSLSVPTRVPRS
jgi:acetoin utilization deacetylase AcuC-like enzyme